MDPRGPEPRGRRGGVGQRGHGGRGRGRRDVAAALLGRPRATDDEKVGLYEFLVHRLEQIAQDPECLASVREIVQYPDEVTAEGAAARAAKRLAQSLVAFVTSTLASTSIHYSGCDSLLPLLRFLTGACSTSSY